MTLTIELPDELEAALKAEANANGVSASKFARQILERALIPAEQGQSHEPFETGRGMLAKYGPAPSAEEIDANRAEMFRNFAREF